ncbi:hypothetical protein F4813DRAFT_386886 [Daldinia decipiens]|uniref:uncharacterized protein n=1 Tax=Daldinia decipiens TaxID=326647 RepID=UPI0020C2CDFB|nr:uncharacterized protein F4813DRAFT_386886 [Daldinia decipiens]KAI1660014.1 hypothetical protein F4813DRAFT_386886 [Daldinia decipiens]
MREKTKAYKEWALAVVNNTQNPLFREHIRHPWQEFGFDIDSRVCIFEFEGDHRGKDNPQFDDARDMLMHWENTPKDGTSETKNRRIILVQDMHPRIIELLGVKLDIPPHFFLAHCDGFVDLSVIDDAYAKQNSSTYWKVTVPRWRSIPENVPNGDYYVEAGNFSRLELQKNTRLTYASLESLVSYWGKSYEPDSWTAVVLIDPYKTYLRPKSTDSSNTPARYELTDISFNRDFLYEVMNTGIRSDTRQSSQRSTFDAAVAAYGSDQLDKLPHTKDPFTGTMFVRNIIRSAWEDFVIRRAREVHDLIIEDQMEHDTSNSGKYQARISSWDTSTIDSYQALMIIRQVIHDEKNAVNSIMWKFRCRDTLSPPPQRNLSQDGNVQQERVQDSSEEEGKSWTMIYEELARVESTIADHMEMWSQRATLVQTAAANRLARTSGQLTKIVTIIVPCSFVASIFSMGGRFAAGEDYFFVYWAISLPVTCALLSWVLYGDIQDVYQKARATDQVHRIEQVWLRRSKVKDVEQKV